VRIHATGTDLFLYLSGLRVERVLHIGSNVDLLPACCSPRPDDLIAVSDNELDLGVAVLFLRSVASQIHVRADSARELAVLAWNTQWDVVLLSAFCGCDVVCNLQCDVPAEEFNSESHLTVTNYHLRGLSAAQPHCMTADEATWVERNLDQARSLLGKPGFRTAVHCLATYRWHPLPRAQLALLWAGVEGLFGVDSELVFRLSLYAARFREPHDEARRSEVFADVKRLYRQRSAAVHGAAAKTDLRAGVRDSSQLLLRLLRRCVGDGDVPKPETLAP
jgi:hypothetical protein